MPWPSSAVAHVVEVVLAELARVVELVVVDQAARARRPRAAPSRPWLVPAVLRLVARRHEAGDHRARAPRSRGSSSRQSFRSGSGCRGVQRLDRPRLGERVVARPAAAARRRGRRARSRRARAGTGWRARPRSARSPSVAPQLDPRRAAVPRVGEEQRAVLADRLEVVAAADVEAAVERAEHVVREAQGAREARRRRRRRRSPARPCTRSGSAPATQPQPLTQ